MTFCGTAPWDPKDEETGHRASGGFPILNAPVTSTGGGVWKHPNSNSVIFYHDVYQDQNIYQVVAKKLPFASTETAKELKINTIAYAREILKKTSLDSDVRIDLIKKEEMITKICADRDILKIDDLKNIPGFPCEKFDDQEITTLVAEEKQILEKEKNKYITGVRKILTRAESGEKFTDRNLLIIALGLKDISVFEGHEDLRDEILANTALLQLIMVTCVKVLIAD